MSAIEVVRTTYATVDFMDYPLIIHHPFFRTNLGDSTRFQLMLVFDRYEDDLQKEFLYRETYTASGESISFNQERQRSYEEDAINKINEYLANSMNTHTIAVSANIKTSDQLLIIGKRSATAIDAGEYYCSVNGQSEFQDANVSFYKTSVFEDLPSMDYQSECRIDLTNEIQREAIAVID